MSSSVILTHRGAKFAKQSRDGFFMKDVIHDGVWIHPLTNQVIEVTPDIRHSMEANMKQFLANGNKVPMPDGHVTDTAANKGFWPGPFVALGDDVMAVAQPTDALAKQQMLDGSADAVSVCWWSKYADSSFVQYENVFEHICLTNYPVVNKQRNFLPLSGKAAAFNESYLLATAVPEEDEALCRGLEKVYVALKQGAGREIDQIMTTPAERLAALLAKRPKL